MGGETFFLTVEVICTPGFVGTPVRSIRDSRIWGASACPGGGEVRVLVVTEYVGTFDRGRRGAEKASADTGVSRAVRLRWAITGSSRAWLDTYRTRAVVGDLIVGVLAGALCYALRFGTGVLRTAWPVLIVPVIWGVALFLMNTYRPQHLGAGSEEYRAIGKSAILVACAVAMISYLGALELPRGLVLPLAPTVLSGSLLVHWLLRRGLVRERRRGDSLLTTIVVGRADSVAAMIREIQGSPQSGMRVVGACVSGLDSAWSAQQHIESVPIYGPPDSALAAVDDLGAQVVAVSSHPDLVGKPLRRLGWALAERKVDLCVSPGIVEVAGPRLSLRPAAGLSLLHVERPISSGSRMVIKRLTDSAAGIVLLVLAVPLFLLIAGLIKATTRGPVFFKQERVGIRGEAFRLFKFRTMVVDAEARLACMSREGQTNAVLFKVRDDPRVTSVGRVLRKYSLDELPQLFNVLRGEMSLVGPRPPLRREVDDYEPDAVQRLRVRPGMTGLWQISGRSDLNWDQSLRLDLWYVDNWSPLLDLQILVRTFRAVVAGAGAY